MVMHGYMMLVKMRLVFMTQVERVLVKFGMLWDEFGLKMKRMMGQTLGLSEFPLGMQVQGMFGKMLGMVGYKARMEIQGMLWRSLRF